MDLGFSEITAEIASSTTAYIVTFSPLFLFIGGLILAFVIISALIGFVPGSKRDDDSFERREPGEWI